MKKPLILLGAALICSAPFLSSLTTEAKRPENRVSVSPKHYDHDLHQFSPIFDIELKCKTIQWTIEDLDQQDAKFDIRDKRGWRIDPPTGRRRSAQDWWPRAKIVALLQVESENRIAGSDQQILMTVDHVGLRRVRYRADPRMPQDLAGGCIISHYVSAHVSGENQLSGRCQDSVTAAEATPNAWVTMTPSDLSGSIVNSCQITTHRCDLLLIFAAQTHRAAWIGLGEIVHSVGIALWDVKETGIGRGPHRQRGRPPNDGSLSGGGRSFATGGKAKLFS